MTLSMHADSCTLFSGSIGVEYPQNQSMALGRLNLFYLFLKILKIFQDIFNIYKAVSWFISVDYTAGQLTKMSWFRLPDR